jgi:hypothetical protein
VIHLVAVRIGGPGILSPGVSEKTSRAQLGNHGAQMAAELAVKVFIASPRCPRTTSRSQGRCCTATLALCSPKAPCIDSADRIAASGEDLRLGSRHFVSIENDDYQMFVQIVRRDLSWLSCEKSERHRGGPPRSP